MTKYLIAMMLVLSGCNPPAPAPTDAPPPIKVEQSEQPEPPVVLRQPKRRISTKTDSVVFVVSCGGSMLEYFGDTKVSLKEAIAKLNPEQKVNVIFCNGDGAALFEKTNLVQATPDTTRELYTFIDDAISTGQSDISTGLEAARALKPDLIWVLSNAPIGTETTRPKPRNPIPGSDVESDVKKQSDESMHQYNLLMDKINSKAIRIAQKCGDEGIRINTFINYTFGVQSVQFLFDLASQSGGICLDYDGNIIRSRPATDIFPRNPLVTPSPILTDK